MNIEINKNAPAYNKTQILVHAPVEHVYKILSTINNWPKWQSNVPKAKIDGTAEAGKRFTWKAGGFKIKSEIHTATAPTELGWTGRMLWIKAIHNWKLIPSGQSTQVIVEESLSGFLAGTMHKTLIEGMDKNLFELKLEAEKKD